MKKLLPNQKGRSLPVSATGYSPRNSRNPIESNPTKSLTLKKLEVKSKAYPETSWRTSTMARARSSTPA